MKNRAEFSASSGAAAKSSVLAIARATGRATVLCQDTALAAYRGAAFLASTTSNLLASSAQILNPFKKQARPARPVDNRTAMIETLQAKLDLPTKQHENATAAIREPEQEEARLAEQKHPLEETLAQTEAALADARKAAAAFILMPEEPAQEELAAARAQEPRPDAVAAIRQPEQEEARLAEQEHTQEETLAQTEAALADARKAAAAFIPMPQELAAMQQTEKPPPTAEQPKPEKEPPAPDQAEEAEKSRETTGVQPEAAQDAAARAQEPRPVVEESKTPFPDVTSKDVQAATFAGAAERLVFKRALADLESPDEATRQAAARTLKKIQHELSVRAIAARFSREASALARVEYVNALNRLGLKQALPLVERALGDDAPPVRLAAVRAMYRCAGAAGAAALVPVLRDTSADVRRRAATCIGWLGQKHLASEFLPLLADTNSSVRSAALAALGNLRPRHVVPQVIELLDDSDESVRQKALSALRVITGERVSNKVPKTKDARQHLIVRWRAWYQRESSQHST